MKADGSELGQPLQLSQGVGMGGTEEPKKTSGSMRVLQVYALVKPLHDTDSSDLCSQCKVRTLQY